MRRTACMLLLYMSSAFGASDFYEAFDFKRCIHWNIDNEPHGIALSNESKEYIAALELANRQTYSFHKLESWEDMNKMTDAQRRQVVMVYNAGAHLSPKTYVAKFGVCSDVLACLPNQDFPLAGATYRKARSKGELSTYKCVRGCGDAPAFIYDMGYENMEGETNVEREAAYRIFRKKCPNTP